jgi:hypothetical protein
MNIHHMRFIRKMLKPKGTRRPKKVQSDLENKRLGVQFLEADLVTIGLPLLVTQRSEPHAHGHIGHPVSRTGVRFYNKFCSLKTKAHGSHWTSLKPGADPVRTWVYTCTPNNFCKAIAVSRHIHAYTPVIRFRSDYK